MSAKLNRYGLEISKACRRFSDELQKSKEKSKPWITQISQTTEVTAVGQKPWPALDSNRHRSSGSDGASPRHPPRKWFQI
jgi:hypothetical protein